MRRIIILFTAVLLALAMTAGTAAASLCVVPGNASASSDAIHGGTLIAEAPVGPEDFVERGSSLANPAGKLAAWEAHFNSPVVEGPICDQGD